MMDAKDIELLSQLLDNKLCLQRTELEGLIDKQGTRFEGLIDKQRTDLEGLIDKQGTRFEGLIEKQRTELEGLFDKRIEQLRTDIMTVVESSIMPQLMVLAEGHESILQQIVPASRIEALEEEIAILKSAVRYLSEKVSALEKVV